jgi:hypothetical protein
VTGALIAKIAAGTLAVGTAVAVGIVLLLPDGDGPAGPPSAWIDDPLHGSTAPVGPVPVTAHAADEVGIAAMELAVNDAVVATHEVPGTPPFWMATFDWAADAPGTAVLRVRARNVDGQWGMPAFATVHIGGRTPTPTPTPTPSPSPSAPPSSTPPTTKPPTTAPPTSPPACVDLVAPDLAAPEHRAVVNTLTPLLDWRYAGSCTPGGFQVQVSLLRDFTLVDLTGSTGGSTTQWTVSTTLRDCATYYWRVRATTGQASGPWASPYAFDVRVRCP